jgi:hypothetical protein
MTTSSQAKNSIGRALLHAAGVRFSEKFEERCRSYFHDRCCYCGVFIEPNSRNGHFDHATSVAASSDTFHLVYACQECNGDKKRAKGWEDFLHEICDGNEEAFQTRRQAILDWFAHEPPNRLSPEAVKAVEEAKNLAIAGFDSALSLLRQRLDEL